MINIKNKDSFITKLAWGLSIAVAAITVYLWGRRINWDLGLVTGYNTFPYFGFLAFSLMWVHYMVAAKRLYFGVPKEKLKSYFEMTSLVVLVAILLHPTILIWRLWRDGFGLPPQSYLENYIPKGLEWAALLGMISFVIFIIYEFRRKFENRSWWRYVQAASDLAMVFIFIHALKLGSDLQDGWVKGLWYFYGFTLVAALGYIYWYKFRGRKT